MRRQNNHHLNCEAPICPFDPGLSSNLDTWCWYPDERICTKSPYTYIQKVQKKIKRLYEKGLVGLDRYFVSSDLLMIKRVGRGLKGRSNRVSLKSHKVSHERKGDKDFRQ